jgi:hypothetical protein
MGYSKKACVLMSATLHDVLLYLQIWQYQQQLRQYAPACSSSSSSNSSRHNQD